MTKNHKNGDLPSSSKYKSLMKVWIARQLIIKSGGIDNFSCRNELEWTRSISLLSLVLPTFEFDCYLDRLRYLIVGEYFLSAF